VLSVHDLQKRFGGVTALDGVSLELGERELLGLIGPNGSGKTTLVNCLSGVHIPDAGQVLYGGENITRWSRVRRARAGLGRTFQNLRLFQELTVAENVQSGGFTGRSAGGPPTRELLQAFGLGAVERSVATHLSYGMQRRVELARAVAGRPAVLLLDEPAAGLSEAERDDLRTRVLRIRDDLGCALIVIDHDMPFMLGLCDRLMVLHEGKVIYSGAPAAAIDDSLVVEAYLGTPRGEGGA
jgi:branched-chain amino acid transport system ATP-binding protein